MNSTLGILLVLCFVVQTTYGKRGFEIIMDSINCTFNPKQVIKGSCFIDKTHKEGRANIDIQIAGEIRSITYTMAIDIIRNKTEHMNLISLQNADGCAFLEGRIDANILNIYRDILAESGDIPKCPIPKDYRLLFQNVRIDVDKFPPYLPDAKFVLIGSLKAEKEFWFDFKLYGSIVQKRSWKFN